MAADERLRIVIEAVNNASKELKEVKKDLGDIEGPAKQAGSGMGTFAKALQSAGVIAAAVKFGKVVYELGEMGAEAQRVGTTFELMAGGAGQAATMLDGLKTATMGTKSEVELMAGATNLMALGFGNSAEELGAIARNVEILGSRFGGTMQIFQLMMSNNSLMRIDSFGIGVQEATERIEEFKAAGMDADKAFDTAVLELMNEKVEQLGGTLEDNTTKIQQNQAAWQDLKTQIGISFAGMATAASGMLPFVDQMTDLLSMTNAAREEFGYWPGTIAGFLEAIDIFDIINTKIDEIELVIRALRAGEDAAGQGFSDVGTANGLRQVADAADVGTKAFGDLGWAIGGAVGEMSRVSEFAAGARLALLEAEASAARAQAQFDRIKWATGVSFSRDMEDAAVSLEELRARQAEVVEELERLEAGHGRAVTVQAKNTLSANELGLATAQLATAQEKLADADPGSEAYYRAAIQVENLQEKLGGASEATTTFINNTKKIGELEGEYDALSEEIDALTNKMLEMSSRFVLSMIEMKIAADGEITETEARMYAAFAEQMGLIDKGALALSDSVMGIMADLEAGLISEEEAMRRLIKATWEAKDAYDGLGRTGQEALSDIIAKGDATIEKLEEIGLSADAAQAAIDRMHGKSLDLEINVVQRGNITAPDGAQIIGRPDIAWNAAGGDYTVNRPTLFGAGDGVGAERVIFIPHGEPGFDASDPAIAAALYSGALAAPMDGGTPGAGGTRIGSLTLNVSGAGDPGAVADAVIRKLERRGIHMGSRLR